jgi:hypothetical protein
VKKCKCCMCGKIRPTYGITSEGKSVCYDCALEGYGKLADIFKKLQPINEKKLVRILKAKK